MPPAPTLPSPPMAAAAAAAAAAARRLRALNSRKASMNAICLMEAFASTAASCNNLGSLNASASGLPLSLDLSTFIRVACGESRHRLTSKHSHAAPAPCLSRTPASNKACRLALWEMSKNTPPGLNVRHTSADIAATSGPVLVAPCISASAVPLSTARSKTLSSYSIVVASMTRQSRSRCSNCRLIFSTAATATSMLAMHRKPASCISQLRAEFPHPTISTLVSSLGGE
mmetsp:Transcript_110389/g.351931  ORF Transcript_110389/g.351931 Transcript_110389/m.351931 type:complete len:229 (+) Transcript_110389:188-874(+)